MLSNLGVTQADCIYNHNDKYTLRYIRITKTQSDKVSGSIIIIISNWGMAMLLKST